MQAFVRASSGMVCEHTRKASSWHSRCSSADAACAGEGAAIVARPAATNAITNKFCIISVSFFRPPAFRFDRGFGEFTLPRFAATICRDPRSADGAISRFGNVAGAREFHSSVR
jgi:hypothetical protein